MNESELRAIWAASLIGAGFVWVGLMAVNLHQQGLMPWQCTPIVKNK